MQSLKLNVVIRRRGKMAGWHFKFFRVIIGLKYFPTRFQYSNSELHETVPAVRLSLQRYIYMKITSTLRNHCTMCDGDSTAEEMIDAAAALGFTDFGMSCHGYAPF